MPLHNYSVPHHVIKKSTGEALPKTEAECFNTAIRRYRKHYANDRLCVMHEKGLDVVPIMESDQWFDIHGALRYSKGATCSEEELEQAFYKIRRCSHDDVPITLSPAVANSLLYDALRYANRKELFQ